LETKDIIKFCLSGNKEAEKRLFMRYANRVYTICLRYSKQKEDAKDLMQECFISLFKNLNKYDDKRGPFEAWMYRVCTNVVLKKIKKKKRAIQLSFPDNFPEVSEYELKENFDQIPDKVLMQAIQELPDGYKQILNLHVFEGLKHTEIAESLGISASTSRTQYGRAKKMLKRGLEKKIIKKINNEERRLA